MEPDVESAKAYARQCLEKLPGDLAYHAPFHTEAVVVPAARALAADAGLDDWSTELLVLAAWFHDIGYVEQYAENEWIAVRVVGEVLPGLGFTPGDVETIQGMIWATRLPQSPTNRLEELMADADLDALGRPDFDDIQRDLRSERAAYGQPTTPQEWLEEQVDFIGAHRYFTPEAKARNDATKARHLAELTAARDRGAAP